MREIALELPQVHDSQHAARVATKLRPVAYAAWDLGAKCKGALSPEQITRARELARQVKDGKLSLNQAINQMKGT